MSLLNRFFGTSLPNVRTKYLSAACEYNVGSSVMSLKLSATSEINQSLNFLADEIYIFRDIFAYKVEYTLSDLCDFNYVNFSEIFNCHLSGIMLLATRCRVECTLI